MSSIIFLPEGHLDDELNYSGTPKYFYNSLITIAKQFNYDIKCIETDEIINTEDIWRLAKIHVINGCEVTINDLNKYQRSTSKNQELIQNINRAHSYQECFISVKQYDDFIRSYVSEKIDKIYQPGDHIISLNPYNPLFDIKYEYSVYIDISLYQFYFKNQLGFLSFITDYEILSYYYNLEKRKYLNARYIFTFSEACKKQIETIYGANNCITVYAGVNIVIPAIECIDYHKNNHSFQFLFVGRNYIEKGGPQVLDAFRMANLNQAQLTIVTSNENISKLQLKDYPNVKFLGIQPKKTLIGLYLSSNVFVFPTMIDAFGIACCEAMACGDLVIATNYFAIPEIIGQNNGNILIDKCDTKELCLAIKKLYNEYELKKEAIYINRSRIEKVFQWDVVVKKIVMIIKKSHSV